MRWIAPRSQRRWRAAHLVDACSSPACGHWLLAIVILLALAACGGSGITQTSQTQHYRVQLTLDGTGFDERTATVAVSDLTGQPVTADQVLLAPVMRQMGMASPEATAQAIAPGRYQAKGEFFSMIGAWEVDVRITVKGQEEVSSFTIDATQQ